jgi:hypothetical protein
MALFTDGPVSGMEDLTAQDTQLPNVANVEGHTFRTLEMVYGDAYSSQLNDRYASKRDQFQERARSAYEKLLLLGIGIAWSPVPRAFAPQVVSAAGSLPDGTYYVAMTWINNKAEEGAPSVVVPATTTGGTLLVQPATAPARAAGWNVYIGADPAALSRQNASPITLSQQWLQPNAIVSGGTAPGCGQSPDYLMAVPRMILRG